MYFNIKKIDLKLFKKILNYSYPILLVGLAGSINQFGDKVMFKFLLSDQNYADTQLGIYGACYKIAVVMVMFVQAFRFAFEPFFFNRQNSKDDKILYARIMNVFVGMMLIVFIGVILFIDILKGFISPSYHEGLVILPFILAGNMFSGIYFSMSVWYKVTDKTIYGALLAFIGALITLSVNILFIGKYGYYASAVANFLCFFVMMVLSYFLMRKYYYIPYNLKRVGKYLFFALIIIIISKYTSQIGTIVKYSVNITLLTLYVIYFVRTEKIIKFKLL